MVDDQPPESELPEMLQHSCRDLDCPRRQNPEAECSVERQERLRRTVERVRRSLDNPDRVAPDGRVRKIALLAGGPLLRESALQEASDEGYLRRYTIQLLHAALLLRSVSGLTDELEGVSQPGDRPLDALERLRRDLRTVAHHSVFGRELEDRGTAPLEQRLDALIQATRAAEELIEAEGLAFDYTKRRLKVPAGQRRPRTFFRNVVAALVQVRESRGLPVSTSRSVLQWLAREMAPFFPANRLSVESGDELYMAVYRELQ